MRAGGTLFAVFAGAAAVGAALFILIYPPVPLLQRAAEYGAPDAVRWEALDRTGMRPEVRGLRIEAQPAGLEAGRLALTHSALRGLSAGVWTFEAQRIRIVPSNPKWPSIDFDSGKGRWLARERRLELREWSSAQLRFDADLEWDSAGRIRAAQIRGNADPSELRKALAGWKTLPSNGDRPERLDFELRYEKGSLLITVNHKPFFRASWRSDGAF